MSRVKHNLVANYLGQGWMSLMNFAFVPLYISYMGIESYALVGMFALLQAMLGFLDMGMTPTLSREMARFTGGICTSDAVRDLLRTIEIVAIFVASTMAILICCSASWLANRWLNVENLTASSVSTAITIMGGVAAFRFVEGIYKSSLIGLQQQVLSNVLGSTMLTLKGVGAVVVLANVSPTIEAFFIWQGCLSVVELSLFAFFTYRKLPLGSRTSRFSLTVIKDRGTFAAGMMGITLLSLLLMQVDKLLLTKFLSLSEYGLYTLSATAAGAVYIVGRPINNALFPRLSELQAANDELGLARVYHQGAQLASVIMGSTAVVMLFFSETFLALWTQDPQIAKNGAKLVALLALGNLLNGMMWVPYQTQLAHGWTGLSIKINCFSLIAMIPSVIWATNAYGPKGDACAWISLNVFYILVGAPLMFRKIIRGEQWSWYVSDLAQPLIAATAAGIAMKFLIGAPASPVGQIAALSIVSLVTLASASVAAHHVRSRVLELGRRAFPTSPEHQSGM